MKASKYNFFTNAEDGKVIAFNFMANSMLKMTSDDYRTFQKAFSEDRTEMFENSSAEALIADLKEGGFIIDDDIDELSLIKYRQESSKYCRTKSYALTIGLTTACNFKCEYCYENADKHGVMSREVEDRIIDYVNNLPDKCSLSVNWYGGEPLLAIDTIYRLSDAIMKIASEKKMNYTAGIITNGYLFNRNIALELKKRNCISAQISLDGDEETHDKRRPLKAGGCTFRQIMENIKETCGIIPINLRINIDKSNISAFDKLLNELEKYEVLDKLSSVTPSLVQAFEYSPESIKQKIFSSEEYAPYYFKQVEMILDKGLNTMIYTSSPSRIHCGALHKNSLVVDPDGNLYKCWDVFGVESEKVGTLETGVKLTGTSLKWLLFDNLGQEKCRNCILLPLCLGSCPRLCVVEDKFVNGRDHCPPQKYDIEKYVQLIYKHRQVLNKNGFVSGEPGLPETAAL